MLGSSPLQCFLSYSYVDYSFFLFHSHPNFHVLEYIKFSLKFPVDAVIYLCINWSNLSPSVALLLLLLLLAYFTIKVYPVIVLFLKKKQTTILVTMSLLTYFRNYLNTCLMNKWKIRFWKFDPGFNFNNL